MIDMILDVIYWTAFAGLAISTILGAIFVVRALFVELQMWVKRRG